MSKANTGTFTNTYKGNTNNRGEFIHDTDTNGRWIKTQNLKMVGPEGYTMPKSLTKKYIKDSVIDTYGDTILVQKDSNYILVSSSSMERNEDKDLDACTMGWYKPQRAEVQLP